MNNLSKGGQRLYLSEDEDEECVFMEHLPYTGFSAEQS